MLVILSRDPQRMQGSTMERAFVLCMTAYNGGPHAVQTSACIIPLRQRMPKGPLDSPALPDQPGMCRARYVVSRLCAEPPI
jgi:hypothetical protein